MKFNYWIFTPFLVGKCLAKLIRFSLAFAGSWVLDLLSVVCHSGHLYYDVRRKSCFCYCPTETNKETLWTLLLWIQDGIVLNKNEVQKERIRKWIVLKAKHPKQTLLNDLANKIPTYSPTAKHYSSYRALLAESTRFDLHWLILNQHTIVVLIFDVLIQWNSIETDAIFKWIYVIQII